MKERISVFMLMARNSFYKILGVLAVMTAIETGLFRIALNRGVSSEGFGLEYVIEKSHIVIVFFIAFVIMDIILISFVGYDELGTHRYTLMRLSVTRNEVFFIQSIFNILCYVLFWATQVLVVVLLSCLYVQKAPEGYVTGQTIFLAFYRSDFLHSLLPFEDFPFWIRNVLVCVALGFRSAMYLTEGGRAKRSYGAAWGGLYVLFIASLGSYTSCIFLSLFSIGCIMGEIYNMNKKENEKCEERLVETCENG